MLLSLTIRLLMTLYLGNMLLISSFVPKYQSRLLQKCFKLRFNTNKLLLMSTNSISIASWNVNGIRSFIKHDNTTSALNPLISQRGIDILCLQETKIQDGNIPDIENELKAKIGHKRVYWTNSNARKGYSGTAILLLNDNVDKSHELLSTSIGEPEGDLEGRTQTILVNNYIIVNVYTPNSGERLKRLDYRVKSWDVAFGKYIVSLRKNYPTKTIVVCGDLNVAHKNIDYFNYLNPRSKLNSGTTPQEQESFQNNLLKSAGLKDIFREWYPDTRMYSYFSPRKGHEGRVNKEGWRLDYLLVNFPSSSLGNHSDAWKEHIAQAPYIEDELCHPFSDHCPVGASFRIDASK